LICLLDSVSVFAQTQPPANKSALDKATLEAYLRNIELWRSEVTVKIDDAKPSTLMPGFFEVGVHPSYNGSQKDDVYYVSQDGRKVIKGEVFDINRSPFQSNIDKLKSDSQPSFGPANAPVTIAIFSDFQCPYCKDEAQVLRQNLAAAFPDKARVIFEDFPLDSTHPWARTAAIAGRCVYRQNPAAFWKFFDWDYENQAQITLENVNGKIQEFVNSAGLDGLQLGRCVETKAGEADVNRAVALGHALQVSATPTIFVNGRKLEGGLPWASLEALIHIELDQQAKAAQAAEKCCEVTIPSLVK
jgi:protein-disulfide isomerase